MVRYEIYLMAISALSPQHCDPGECLVSHGGMAPWVAIALAGVSASPRSVRQAGSMVQSVEKTRVQCGETVP